MPHPADACLLDVPPPSTVPLGPPPARARRAAPLRVGLLGLGGVGQAFVRRLHAERERLLHAGIDVSIEAALVRDARRRRALGAADAYVTSDPLDFFGRRYDVVVEALGGVEPARRYVAGCLSAGVCVVTANKSLVAAHGDELDAIAARSGAVLRREAAVVAGVPLLCTLRERPLAARVRRISGIVNGTSNVVVTRLRAREISLDAALADARRLGFAEPDARADVGGRDAAEKLLILLSAVGVRGLTLGGLEVTGIESLTAADVRQARALGGAIRPVIDASLDRDGVRAFVGPAFVPLTDPLADVDGVRNAVRLTNAIGGEWLIAGPGAGPDVTAGTLLDDLLEVSRVLGRRAASRNESPEPPPFALPPQEPSPARWVEPQTPWLLRFCFPRRCTRFVSVAGFLESHGVEVRQLAGAPPHPAGDLLHALVDQQPREQIRDVLAAFAGAHPCQTLALRVLSR